MGLFADLTTDTLEESKDTLGGFQPLESDAYMATIKLAYAGTSRSSKAQSITIHAEAGGQEIRETIWITNGKGENFYVPKDNAKAKLPLPGFTTIDDICLLTTGEPLSDQPTETKTVKLYDFETRGDKNTEVPVLVDLLGKEVCLGILKEIRDKETKGDDGKYHPNGETRTVNVIDKVFHPETLKTVNEYRHEVENAEFHPAWVKKNQGKDRDRSTKQGGNVGASGSGRPGGQRSATKKLFG